MTTIKSITAKGFKSFAKKTELVFGNNFNLVLGPNGSGKSNIIDMMCFVLGKSSAKSLRAEKSSHLIYNGGKLGQPANEAEVSIVFDNSDKEFPIADKTIKITRIVKKAGNSIYKLNNKTLNRQQIVDLLSQAKIDPDGHNIILQGDIVRFMEMRPNERREIIEEVSGISIYEDKKIKALNELEKVSTKLSEAGIILTERKAHLRELKKERDQALEYKNTEKNIKENKATYLHLQIKSKNENKQHLEAKIKTNQQEINRINSKVKELKSKINEFKIQISDINKEIEEKGEKEQVKLHKDIEELKTDLLKNSNRLENCKTEIEKINNRNTQLKIDSQELGEKIFNLKKSLQELQKNKNLNSQTESRIVKELNQIKEKYNIKDQDSIELNIDKLQSTILKLQGEKQNFLREYDKLNFQIQDIEKKLSTSSTVDLKEIKNNFKIITQSLNKSSNEDSALSLKLSNLRKELVDKNEALTKLNIQNISSKQLTLDSLATKKILGSGINGIHNIVAELGQAEKKYSLALEVAAGPRLKSIVVENDEVASKCIKYLKENKLGIATFLPLNKIKSYPTVNFGKSPGVHGLALDLVKFNPKFSKIFSYVFGSTLVVDNINTTRRIGIGTIRMVTLDGDLAETSGAMIGGHRKSRGVAFKEVNFNDKIDKLNSQVLSLKSLVSSLENQKLNNENLMYDLKKQKADLEAEIIKTERTSLPLTELNQQKQEFSKRLKEINSLLTKTEKEITDNTKTLETLKSKKQKTVNISSISNVEKQYQDIREKTFNIDSEIKNTNTQINFHQQEKDKISSILNNNIKETESFKKEVLELNKVVKENSFVLKDSEKKEKQFYSNFKSLFDKRNQITSLIQQKESNLIREEEKVRSFESKINNISLDKAKITAELEALEKENEPFKGEKIKRNVNLDELRFEIQRSEKMLNNMGNVNLRALEVYEELQKDHEKLLEKAEKLKIEQEDVLVMMNEIESNKTDLFMQTYKVIARNFQEIFATLSTKGTAHLELEDPNNPLTAGLKIRVKIAGNKYLDIKSLSGGEKTMTALAFIFSIQELQPASFYLMDEVDAALDKTNSDKLSKLISQYSKSAQYIVISHNDVIISEAEQIYGVSMQQGISKVMSLKI
ncbi:MAG: chromosome segregation protein SMC [Nanoarchaeota archaeon]|nr:chromosome segregation protein SMC [Nanoarchaeota archaeon]